jgi:hypothetical protein
MGPGRQGHRRRDPGDQPGLRLFLKDRGYVVDPDPTLPSEVQEAFQKGSIKSFARHSRLGGTNMDTVAKVREDFMSSVDYLRKIGFQADHPENRLLRHGRAGHGHQVRHGAGCDLLTIDGSGGGTGMSPWNMMQSWGVPSINLHAKAYEYASILAAKGQQVVDMSFAGGFALEDSIFKAWPWARPIPSWSAWAGPS